MKSFIIILFFFGFANSSYCQDKKSSDSDEGSLKLEQLPEVVIRSAGKDFSVYLTDKNPDASVRGLQEQFISYNLGKDYEGFDSYLVTMQTQNGSLAATYNANGKLTRVVENYQNVRLPSKVIYSVYKEFPGWQIINDKFLFTQEDGDIIKKQYHLKIKKNNEVRKLVVHANGEILKGVN
ncbi:hypothetical protein [Flavobacterium xinjiangense]|jgi:hypothetical protein|uniref:Beta-lactamase-inhibitor-like, PepSY-like n=1 Tax=Flavobacterium xinjiangense TaxID=178356 RepID=A0A1M7FR94_9FLAO|nr:hypothetical protein [Flavobacterium xinjiangense]SHM06632.1 hypothetical protein SAMN05216269_102240 [Flavobacterium xinjiangense]